MLNIIINLLHQANGLGDGFSDHLIMNEIVFREFATSTADSGSDFRLDGSLAHTTPFENAIRIRRKGRRLFLFSTKNPEKVVGIFNDMRISGAIGPLNCIPG